jgi:hypothetical protein
MVLKLVEVTFNVSKPEYDSGRRCEWIEFQVLRLVIKTAGMDVEAIIVIMNRFANFAFTFIILHRDSWVHMYSPTSLPSYNQYSTAVLFTLASEPQESESDIDRITSALLPDSTSY